MQSLRNLSEHDVLPVEVGRTLEAQEELGAVCGGTGVRHGEDAATLVLQREVFVCELAAVDGLAPGAISLREVSALGHEPRDDPVEDRALEVERLATLLADALLAGAESPEVLARLRSVGGQLHVDLAKRGAVYRNLKKYSCVG